MSGQSVLDRMNAARHTITGSDLAKSVYKATTEEVLGPKKKHLDYLLQCTNTEHINIPELADMIIERSTNANWVVAFKTLVTCHHLMVYGNERFLRYLATRTTIFNLEEFTDKGGAQGYEMSIFVRKYSKYLNQKAYSYRNMAFDFCRAKRGKEDGVLRTMTTDKLLKALPHLQSHLDALLDFEVNSAILSNGVINSAFLLLFKDCIRLFACYNDGIINLLDKFFEMPKKECKIALDLYKKFLIRMEKVAEFLKVAEQVGVDKGEIPDLAKAPSSLLEALENHLASLEGKVKANWTKPQVAQQAVNAFTSSLAASDVEKERAIEEEKERLAALKIQTANTYNTTDQARLKEIVGSSPTHQPAAHAAPPQPVQPPATSTPAPNPFTSPQPVQAVPVQAAPSADLFSAAPGFPNNNTIGADFQSAFGTPVSGIQEPAILPQNAFMQSAAPMSAGPPMGEILQPMNKNPPPAQSNNVATASISDLDSTLSSLATNLDIKGGPSPKKTDHQWSKSTNSNVRTGGQTWQPKQVASTTTWPQQPMPGQYMGMNMGMNAGMNMGMQPGMAPMGMAGGYGQPMMGQPMGYPYQRPPQQQTQQSDPFGPY